MSKRGILIEFVLREWLMVASAVGLVTTSIYLQHIPKYSVTELQVLFILFILFVAVSGLQKSGLITWLAQGIERGKAIPLKLVIATFLLSTVVTNDVALIVMVPLTTIFDMDHKDLVVIFEAMAANAGSALTPFGNPQNLFIYWFYGLNPSEFILSIAPFSLVFFVLLFLGSYFIDSSSGTRFTKESTKIERSAYFYLASLVLIFLCILHLLPIELGFIILIPVIFFDKRVLIIDYGLLFTFFFFFGLAENVKFMLQKEISHYGNIFLFSALVSQVISNVPAAILFAKFTKSWEALLWGTNSGGFGSLFGSLANLIAYKLFVTSEKTCDPIKFTVKFLIIGYLAFFIAVALYFLLHAPNQIKLLTSF